LLIANGFGQAAAAASTALLVETVFNRLAAGGAQASVGAIAPFAAALSGAALIVAVLRARERTDAERLGQSYVHDLRIAMYKRLSSLAPRALQSRSQGGVLLRFVGDLRAIGQWVSLGLSRLLVGTTFVIGALAALAFVSPALAVAVAVVLVPGMTVAFFSGRTMRERTREARRKRVRLAANMNEKVATIGVVQLFGQTRRERRRVVRQSRELSTAMVARAQMVGRLRGIYEGTALIASVAVLLVGAEEIAAGRAKAGAVVAAMSIVGLLVGPLRDLGRVHEVWHDSRVSLEKVYDFLATPNVVRVTQGAPSLEPGPGRLEFDDVRVSGALFGASAVAEPGTLVALVGPNGAGKSTLLALAARLLDPDDGRVLLDGQDLTTRKRSSLRRAVSGVGPDFPLLRGSVDKNLRYRRPDAPEEELARIRRLCGIDSILAELPDGAETRVVEGGRNLSAGQRQRIALARALLGDPRVLLLDEADSNLDEKARSIVDRVIQDQRGERTVVVVSHRPDVLRWADAVWRLEEGRLDAVRARANVKPRLVPMPTQSGALPAERALSSYIHPSAGHPAIRVWLAAPPTVGPQTRLVVVMHGVRRNAREYAAEWADWAASTGHVVAVPHFDREGWRGADGYNLGNVLDGSGGSAALNPIERWAFTVVDEIQSRLRRRLGIVDERFVLWGHSAGAQFAHRFPLFRPRAKLRAVIVAGGGWFMLPDPDVDFPYGTRHPLLCFPRRRLLDWTRLPIVLVRGTLDLERDPDLRTTPEAETQGANRFERASCMVERARSLNPNTRWRLMDVTGVDHDYLKMIPATQARWDSLVEA
jgi:ABC-type multidrug transport system fused ATPase/permease subunit